MGEVMDENYNQNYVQMDNRGYTSENALSLRLDVQSLINNIENYLRGVIYQTKDDGVVEELKIGEPLANQAGIQNIMFTISSYMTPHLAQGYFPEKNSYSEMHTRIINDINLELTMLIITNRIEWDVQEREMQGIIDRIVNQIEVFLTRPIGDRERTSYGHSLKHIETNNYKDKGSGLFNFFGKK